MSYSASALHLSAIAFSLSVFLSGCTTVRVPNVDFIKLPEFREIVRNNQTNVPDISDLPDTPDDVRSKESWDEQAGKLLGLREEFMIPQSAEGLMSADDIDAEFEQRKIRAQAYKLDDP